MKPIEKLKRNTVSARLTDSEYSKFLAACGRMKSGVYLRQIIVNATDVGKASGNKSLR